MLRRARSRKGGMCAVAVFHHDPDHDDDFMNKLEAEARQEWKGALVAREQMILTPGL